MFLGLGFQSVVVVVVFSLLDCKELLDFSLMDSA